MSNVNASSDVIDFIKKLASRYKEIEKIVLFGPRVRDEDNEQADYDLAIYSSKWPVKFALELRDEIPTLHGINLVDMSYSFSSAFLEQIEAEAVVIFQKG